MTSNSIRKSKHRNPVLNADKAKPKRRLVEGGHGKSTAKRPITYRNRTYSSLKEISKFFGVGMHVIYKIKDLPQAERDEVDLVYIANNKRRYHPRDETGMSAKDENRCKPQSEVRVKTYAQIRGETLEATKIREQREFDPKAVLDKAYAESGKPAVSQTVRSNYSNAENSHAITIRRNDRASCYLVVKTKNTDQRVYNSTTTMLASDGQHLVSATQKDYAWVGSVRQAKAMREQYNKISRPHKLVIVGRNRIDTILQK